METESRIIALVNQFSAVRAYTERLCEPLAIEDYGVQALPDGAPDASPPKWHLAHTTWFFETFILSLLPKYAPYNLKFRELFNSYYNGIGPQWPRSLRGTLSRPTVEEVYRYRHVVTAAIIDCAHQMAVMTDSQTNMTLLDLLELGIHHEQQHQELLLMDIKAIFGGNPLFPAYRESVRDREPFAPPQMRFLQHDGGLHPIGHDKRSGKFALDNESPRHTAFLNPFLLADRLVTCGEYLEFIRAEGYQWPVFWLDDGWNAIRTKQWDSPAYWHHERGERLVYTLSGLKKLDLNEPVSHISFFEADAYARWRDCRLPTEQEFEVGLPHSEFDDPGLLWEWTGSPYRPYPGYKLPMGEVGEYNGKFMNGQYVLRGGSIFTPIPHYRRTYRNFYPPDRRWMFSGIRLAKDV